MLPLKPIGSKNEQGSAKYLMKKLCATCGGVIFALGVLSAPDILTVVCGCRKEEIPAHTHTESPMIMVIRPGTMVSSVATATIAGVVIKNIDEEIQKLKLR